MVNDEERMSNGSNNGIRLTKYIVFFVWRTAEFELPILSGRASDCASRKGAIKDVHRSNETHCSVFIGRLCTAERGVIGQLRNHAARDSASKNRDGPTHRGRADRGLLYRAAVL